MSDRMDDKHEAISDGFETSIKALITSRFDEERRNYLKRYGIYLSKLERKFGLGMPDKDLASRALK